MHVAMIRAISNFFRDYWRMMCGRPLLGEISEEEYIKQLHAIKPSKANEK